MGDNTKWHRINIKLYPVILEKSLKALGLPTNNYTLLGGGSNGHAYLSNNRVYKITTDKSEAVESNKLVGKNNSRIANIFDVKRINTTLTDVGLYLIVLENLNIKTQSIFEDIENSLKKLFKEEFDLHFMDIIYFYRFYYSTYKNEYEKRVNELLNSHQREKYYYNSLLEIVDELKKNNIQSLDLQYHNLGLKPNGNLAYFDLGIGDAYGNVNNSIDIGENINERNKEYINKSISVSVKKNCQLGGKPDGTSNACNQGDISNLILKPLNEVDQYEIDFRKWKRDNVTYRGISKDSVDGTNNGMAMLGQGLYSVPASNKSMARKYGNLVILVNAKPKNPKVFNTLNDWEIWFQNNVVLPKSKAKGKDYPDSRDIESITDEMLKLGYDGIIIKGREMVNYKPEDVRYFYNERQLEMYYDDFVAPNKRDVDEDLQYSHVDDASPNSDEFMIGESLDVGSTFPKVGYRVGEKNTMRNLTVQDVLNFEAEELGNDYIRDQAMKLNIDYCKIPADKVIWVTMKPEDAEKYKPTDNVSDVDVEEIHFSGKPIVIAVDDDNGYLVLRDSYSLNEDESSGFDLKKFTKMEIVNHIKNLKNKSFIKHIINDLNGEVFLVGGAIRDLILKKNNKDIDLVVRNISKEKLLNTLKSFGTINNVGESFAILKFTSNEDGLEYDIALPRVDKKNNLGGYKGFDITSDHELEIEKDLIRRDAKINSMAINLNTEEFIDPTGGLDDIKNKRMSMTNKEAFSDDPLRLLRMVSFASRFNFDIEPETMKSIQKNAEKIKEISPERILIEFDKIVEKGNPLVAAKLLRQTGLYPHIFGTNRGINLAGFKNVKTMGEFIYLLTKDNLESPSKFYKENLKGDLKTYDEIRALEIGGEFRQDELGNPYKRIYDMYKIHPNIINTDLFGGQIKKLASEMKSKNIPFTLKEVPVNGNDLISLGYNGKEIGAKFVDIMNKIYRGELENKRESILNYLNFKR